MKNTLKIILKLSNPILYETILQILQILHNNGL